MTSVDYTYTRMAWDEAWHGGIETLSHSHFIETGDHRYERATVDAEMYRQSERAGILRVYVCQFHGQIVGYCIFIVTKHNHYKGQIQASHDVTYIAPAHRGWTAFHLVRLAEQDMREEGVTTIYQAAPYDRRGYDRVLERLGYEPSETLYIKHF